MTKKNIDREALYATLRPGDLVWLDLELYSFYECKPGDELIVISMSHSIDYVSVRVKNASAGTSFHLPIFAIVFAEEDEGEE